MKHLYILLVGCMMLTLATPGVAQFTETISLFQTGSYFTGQQIESISRVVSGAVLTRLDESLRAQLLKEKRSSLTIELPFTDGSNRTLYLKRFNILAPDAKTVAGTDGGDREFSIREHFVTYRGYMEGEESSLVSISFSPLGVIGVINSFGENYVIAGLEQHPEFNKGDYVIFSESRVKLARNFFCASELMQASAQVEEIMASTRPGAFNAETSTLLECEVALESDYETYQRFGSSAVNATSYMLSVMSVASALYIRDLNVKIIITFTRVWDTVNDPYDGTTSFQLLNQFRNHWISNMQFVHRDLAHYISTRPGGLGGVAASIGGLCQILSNGYAFSNTGGSFPALPVYSWDVDVVSHETGHNFGSYHTHSCTWNPPIDTCVVTSENSPCASTPAPRLGTIMSYCHLSASKTLNFHPLPVGAMRAHAEASSCISPGSSALELALPNGGEIYYINSPIMIIWEGDSIAAVDLYFSPDSGVTWDLISANVSAADRGYEWTIPSMIPTTDRALVRIVNSANPAEADTSDAPFSVQAILFPFSLLDPPHLSTVTITPGDTTPVDFVWSSAGTFSNITYRAEISFIVPGLPTAFFISNNGGTDTTASIPANAIDSLLTAWNAWGGSDSVRAHWMARAFFEGDSLRSSNLRFLFFKSGVTAISQPLPVDIPRQLVLHQNYPNPFNPATNIRFSMPNSAKVNLSVYNLLGKKVAELLNENLQAGIHTVTWNGNNQDGKQVSSGLYFYRLETEQGKLQKKMLYLR